MPEDYLEELLQDEETRAKIYYAFNIGLILVNVLIVLGAIFFVLRVLGVV